MATYNNQAFSGFVTVQGNTYNTCSFTNAILNYGTGNAQFNSGCVFNACQVMYYPNGGVHRSYHRNAQFFNCDIDTSYKEFENSYFYKCFFLDGIRYNQNPYSVSFDASFGSYWFNNTAVDSTFSSQEPFWLYTPINNTFSGYIKSMPMRLGDVVEKSWSDLKEGATFFFSGAAAGNVINDATNIVLLGSTATGTRFYAGDRDTKFGSKAGNARLSFCNLGQSYTGFTDSMLAFTYSYGESKIVGSRSIADSSSYLLPTNISEESSFVQADILTGSYGANERGSLRDSSFKGADFGSSSFPSLRTRDTDITDAVNPTALNGSGTKTSEAFTRYANNFSGSYTLSDATGTMYATPQLGPGNAVVVAVNLYNGGRYNFKVEDSLVSSIDAYLLPYSALSKIGLISGVMSPTKGQMKKVAKYYAMTGDQMQDVVNHGATSYAYLLLVNKGTAGTYTLGVSGRTGIINASSLVANSTYDLVSHTTVSGIGYTADYGTLHYNASVDGNPLTCMGFRYNQGFGCHANCTITVPVDNSRTVGTLVGFAFDDEIHSSAPSDVAVVHYELKSGATSLFVGSDMRYNKRPQWKFVAHSGYSSVQLKGVATGSIGSAHVDFLYPTFVVSRV